jgi:hypothetical protein
VFKNLDHERRAMRQDKDRDGKWQSPTRQHKRFLELFGGAKGLIESPVLDEGNTRDDHPPRPDMDEAG